MTTTSGVCAIIVTFQPEAPRLHGALQAICPQVGHVLVVDNGSAPERVHWLRNGSVPGVELMLVGKNEGTATAINRGVTWATEKGCSHVLLLDQDSLPARDMVAQLMRAERLLAERGEQIAAVGAQPYDPRFLVPLPFIRFEKWAFRRIHCRDDADIHEVGFVISSGSLVAITVLNEVGGMRDDLFIDYVDVEWALRARSHRFKCFGVCAAKMQHNLGDAPMTAFRWWRVVPMRKPLRHYYHFRNAVALYREACIPLHWKVQDGIRLVLRLLFYGVFASPRTEHWKMMALGLWHGVIGRMGRYQ